MRALGGETLRVGGLSPDDVAALTDIGGGDPAHGAAMVLRGYLAGRRVAAMRKMHEKAPTPCPAVGAGDESGGGGS